MSDLRVSFPKPCAEPWDEMRPAGCNRHCDACDKVIHDLSLMTIDEAEELLRVDPAPCVWAEIDSQGIVNLKSASRCSLRVVRSIGASMSLAVAACQTGGPAGSIAGRINIGSDSGFPDVRARDVDGRIFRAKVSKDGRYEVSNLPAGTYTLTFSEPYCGPPKLKKIEDVEVGKVKVEVEEVDWSYECAIIIGMMSLDPDQRG